MTIFKSGELRIIILITLGVTLIGVTVAVIVSLSRRPEPVVVELEAAAAGEEVQLSDFMLPKGHPEGPGEGVPDYKLARPPHERWSREEMERFWTDPAEAGLETLAAENDRFVDEYFNAVP